MTMLQPVSDSGEILARVHAALGAEPRIDLAHHPVRGRFESGAMTLEGELPSIAAKKIALRLAAALPEVVWVVDRLRVAPSERMTDDQVREHVRNALLEEPALIPSLDGSIDVTVPAGTQPGLVLRLAGKGLPEFGGHKRGNLYVRVDVRVPDRLSKRQRELFEELRALEASQDNNGQPFSKRARSGR